MVFYGFWGNIEFFANLFMTHLLHSAQFKNLPAAIGQFAGLFFYLFAERLLGKPVFCF
jgi:hypothetical protein